MKQRTIYYRGGKIRPTQGFTGQYWAYCEIGGRSNQFNSSKSMRDAVIRCKNWIDIYAEHTPTVSYTTEPITHSCKTS